MDARIASYELAAKMQLSAPQALDISSETEATKKLYGLDEKITEDFGKRCLIGRRLLERGVRFVQIWSGAGGPKNNWDNHSNILNELPPMARSTDKPAAALLTDLKARGLLDDTLLIFSTEFGRMPFAQDSQGRDHNGGTSVAWLAGAGGESRNGVRQERRVGMEGGGRPGVLLRSARDNSASDGINHEKLTYRHNGIDRRFDGCSRESHPRNCGVKSSIGKFDTMDLELKDHAAIITGGASGIGRAAAERFAAEGAHVAIWDVSASFETVAAEIAQRLACARSGNALISRMNLRCGRRWPASARGWGTVDHLVHSAGIGSGKFGFPFTNLTPSDWPRTLNVNIMGMVNVAHAVAPFLTERKSGSMIFIASVAGQMGSQTDPPYSAAKAANINFAQCLAKDLAPHGVRVNTVCPEWFRRR